MIRSKHQPVQELEALRRRVVELEKLAHDNAHFSKLSYVEHGELIATQHDLKERSKELTCLRRIIQTISHVGLNTEEVLKNVVDFIKDGCQYPEITAVRLIVRGKEFKTDNFRTSEWKQSSDIRVNGGVIGVLDVYYLEDKPEIDEEPFLKEEKALFESIAQELEIFFEGRQAEEHSRIIQERFRGIYNSSKDAIGFANLKGVMLDVNDSFCQLTGYSRKEWLAGKTYQSITPEEYRKWEAEIIEEIKRTGNPSEYEKEYIRKDGSRIPILVTTFVVKRQWTRQKR